MHTLFNTIHGSRLYGLNGDDSDHDFFAVVSKRAGTTAHTRKRYAKQTIHNGTDSVVVDLGTFIEGCKKGVPQYCEAMFSQMATVDEISDLRNSFILTSSSWDTYLRTIKSFAFSEKDSFKRKRHALRLAVNLYEIRHTGRFNPTLERAVIDAITAQAGRQADDVYHRCMKIVGGGLQSIHPVVD